MKYTFLFCLFVVSTVCFAQFTETFDDKSFPNNPLWMGDVADFIVNDAGQLQLNADGSGTSSIFTTINPRKQDTTSFAMQFNLAFNPSSGNALTIYLALDDSDLTTASGYVLQMGESGSEDAVKFIHINKGTMTELASGTLGAVASNPNVNFRMDAFPSGMWVFNVDYTGGTLFEEDIVIQDTSFDLDNATTFGITCKYSSSRAKSFFFDNISVKPFEQDKTPPTISNIEITDANTIEVVFSEPIQQPEKNSFSIEGNNPSNVTLKNQQIVILTFDVSFPSDKPFELIINDIKDLNDNKTSTSKTFTLSYARLPLKGDVIINEILFAPSVSNGDFVELLNLTNDYLNLSGYILGNNTRTSDNLKFIPEDVTLAPNQHIAFTENKQGIIDEYQPKNTNTIIETDIPGFNNDNGNVYFATPDSTVIDSYDYDDDQHLPLLLSTRGVSLERTSTTLPTNDTETWASAASTVGYATPGYKNSTMLPDVTTTETFELIQKTFSPNGDNIDDKMLLGYSLDKNGYIANIEIRDIAGFLIKKIAQNVTLSTEGIISWDGLDEDGNVANVGMYIVLGEVFHSDGTTKKIKKVCTLANNLTK